MFGEECFPRIRRALKGVAKCKLSIKCKDMTGNKTMTLAKLACNDEFYTQYDDIQDEVNAYLEYDHDTFRDKTVLLPCDDPDWSKFTRFFAENFTNFGLKKLISTSFAHASKNVLFDWNPTEFETGNPNYDPEKSRTHGKVFTIDRATHDDKRIDINNLEWHYLNGTGDFNSKEVRVLRDESDIIITNPPFSQFRRFVKWIFDGGKKFLIIGNKNAITYKEIFPLIKDNKLWVGATPMSKDMLFMIPQYYIDSVKEANRSTAITVENGKIFGRSPAVWLTNLDHGRRHEPLKLLSMAENVKYSRHKDIIDAGYRKYDNYDAIDVPYSDAIPSDYKGVMGVPITFLDGYCPEQFEIVGTTESEGTGFSNGVWNSESGVKQPLVDGKRQYKRIFIKHKDN